jgi:hypothetical protein
MFGMRGVARLTLGVVTALALGALVTYVRLLPGSDVLAASALVFTLCVASVVAGVAIGSQGQPNETAYW